MIDNQIFMASKFTYDNRCLAHAVLHTVAYADIFDYPLTVQEIHRFLTSFSTPYETVEELFQRSDLVPELLHRVNDYYILPGREDIIATRKHREQVAVRLWEQAEHYGRLIGMLPFVRMVAVTGSLAMNNAEENEDLDYLIVTESSRLWLCRLLVLAVVRLASWRGVRLCPNYFITQNVLEFSEKTLYVAHELVQMVPLSGLGIYQMIRMLNPWVKQYIPNADGVPQRARKILETESMPGIRSLLEAILSTPLGAWLEHWEMKRKIRKLSRENIGNPEASFTADVCKGHFNRHGQYTREKLNERLARLALEPGK